MGDTNSSIVIAWSAVGVLLLVVNTFSFCATSIDVHPQDIYFCSSSEKCIKCGTALTSWHCWKTIYELFKNGVSM